MRYEDKKRNFHVKLETVAPLGEVMDSKDLSMVIVDDPESMVTYRLFIHIGECLYRIDKTGAIIEKIFKKENIEPVEVCIGTLNKKIGYNNIGTKDVGTPVYEFNGQYIIKFDTIEMKYSKKELSQIIDFI